MGPLVAAGGIHVPGDEVRNLETALNKLCSTFGLPARAEFKWSPGRELWMHDHMTGDVREEFFVQTMQLAAGKGVRATVVVEDTHHDRATSAGTAEDDVTTLLIERVHSSFRTARTHGILIIDRPSGDRGDENRFLSRCLDTIESGTEYVLPDRIAINAVSTRSELVRLLQLADVVTSCTTAMVAGESRFAPPVFTQVKELLVSHFGSIGGRGLKIHPDGRYANLYHWLCEDTHFTRDQVGWPMPLENRPYSTDPYIP